MRCNASVRERSRGGSGRPFPRPRAGATMASMTVTDERREIEQVVEGRTVLDAIARTVAAYGDRPAYSDQVRPDRHADGSWRTLHLAAAARRPARTSRPRSSDAGVDAGAHGRDHGRPTGSSTSSPTMRRCSPAACRCRSTTRSPPSRSPSSPGTPSRRRCSSRVRRPPRAVADGAGRGRPRSAWSSASATSRPDADARRTTTSGS